MDVTTNQIHRHHHCFGIKFLCDVAYVLMKPAEEFFLFVFYSYNAYPEASIERQYLSQAGQAGDREPYVR